MDSWLERYYHPLVGYTISDITLTPDDEGDQWATLTLTKGAKTIKVEVWRDEEGNGPGVLQIGDTAPFVARHVALRGWAL